jgi:hypothetical protein
MISIDRANRSLSPTLHDHTEKMVTRIRQQRLNPANVMEN